MADEFIFNVSISLEGDEVKKNNVRDWLVTKLTEYRGDGTILSASLSITRLEVPESVTLSRL